ncbi:MAG: hypothetical protein E3K37_09455 [Candidatus Kuenenia sp.]|nr:hypothetical protein [Candidatus Kuenenia hertensis]
MGLNLKELSANIGGDATLGADGDITITSGTTLELLYGGSTLDTAPVSFNSGSFSFQPGSVSPVTTNSLSASNVIISLTDQDENLNPATKDVIGFADNSASLSGFPGTASSRVQIEVIDQTTGTTLTNGVSLVSRNIMLIETGNNTGIFAASGKVFGTSTTVNSSDLKTNVLAGSSSTSSYTGDEVTLGDLVNGPGVTFQIIEVNASGSLGLVYSGTATVASGVGTASFAYKQDTGVTTTFGTNYGTSSLSISRAVAVGTNTCAFDDSSVTINNSLIKLIDGNNYCLVAISAFKGTDTVANGLTEGEIFTNGNGGSITVSLDSFQLVGAREGDTLKVSYLDEFTTSGTSGTVTATAAYGLSGVTGTLEAGSTSADINDSLKITVVDNNLNTSTSSKETVLWSGTTTNRRGDHLTITNYSSSYKKVSVSHQDGFSVGTQSIRISNTDNTYVWMVPTSLADTFGNPLSSGSITFSLDTQTISTVPLVNGSSSDADDFLTTATTASFIATLDGLDNSVEISPDGTHWISVPITETSVNSSTFTTYVGFNYKTIRLTTNTSLSVTNVISDFTGTSTLFFPDGNLSGDVSILIGTGSVVRVFDGTTQEFVEVASPGATTLSVSKLSCSSAYDPDKTWVQLIGNDRSATIGGYYGATYRIRYNDATGDDNAYLGGDTLAVTTSDVAFTTNTGVLSTDITGTTGPNTWVTVTLVDQDLNTSGYSQQNTYEADSTSSGIAAITLSNENGLGTPSGLSTSLSGGTAKIVYASTLNSMPNSSASLGSEGNTIDFTLTETDKSTGTFKGSFKLSSGTSTTNSSDILKVTNGDSVYVFYNDSPNENAADNSGNYLASDPITIEVPLTSLVLSKETAFLSGDTIVVTVIDSDLNVTSSSLDTSSVRIISSSDNTGGSGHNALMTETATNSGTFQGTFTTGANSSAGNAPTIRAVANGLITVTYQDVSPAEDITAQVSTKNFGAIIDIVDDSIAIEGNTTVSLYDPEKNTSIHSENYVAVNITSTTDSSGTTLSLKETGNDTGSFIGTIEVSAGDTLSNTRIKATVGDTVAATHTDNPDVDGGISVVSDTAAVDEEALPTPTSTPTVTVSATSAATPTATATPGITPAATISPVSTCSITGFVMHENTGTGIDGALISIDMDAYTTMTDASRFYKINDMPEGSYTITASATGYTSETVTDVTVAGGETEILNFELAEETTSTPTSTIPAPSPTASPAALTATLVVSVLDGNGVAIENADVTVDGESGTIDSGGAAAFILAVGSYTVTVSADGYESETVDVTVTAPITMKAVTLIEEACPDPADAATASADQVELTLAKGDSEYVTITVTDNDGCPAEGVKVKRKLSSKSKKKIKVTPSSEKTDSNGQATFTITAKKKNGTAAIKFKIKGVNSPKVSVSLAE